MSVIKLGGANIKKSKFSKPYLADERSLWETYSALAACVLFGFYPYEYSIFEQINPFYNKLGSNEIDKPLKKQDE
ncbi:hypothetical protein [Clostridium thailandense]|uniref:hypothetical protein n=1 Tax=Clostridium thailandense TaxID=2794346 RepID=UPI0039893DAB